MSSVSKCVQGDDTESSHLPLNLALNFILSPLGSSLSGSRFLRTLLVVGRRALFTVDCPPRRSADMVAHRPAEPGPDLNLFVLLDHDLINSSNRWHCDRRLLTGVGG